MEVLMESEATGRDKQENDSLIRMHAMVANDPKRADEVFYKIDAKYRSMLEAFFISKNLQRADVEDLVQETLILIMRKSGTFRGDSAESTWIHRIAFHLYAQFLEKKRKRNALQQLPEECLSWETEPWQQVHLKETTPLRAALRQLLPHSRIAMELDLKGESNAEIAKNETFIAAHANHANHQHVKYSGPPTVSAVKKIIYNAKKEIGQYLRAMGILHPAEAA